MGNGLWYWYLLKYSFGWGYCKVFFLNELAPASGRGFFATDLIIADWVGVLTKCKLLMLWGLCDLGVDKVWVASLCEGEVFTIPSFAVGLRRMGTRHPVKSKSRSLRFAAG
jgi:hypothetical protein